MQFLKNWVSLIIQRCCRRNAADKLLLSECKRWCGEVESAEGTDWLNSGEHSGAHAPNGVQRSAEEGLGGGGGPGQREIEDPWSLDGDQQGTQRDCPSGGRGGCPFPAEQTCPVVPALRGWLSGVWSTLCESLRELPGAGGDVRVQLCQCKALAASRSTALLALASRWEVEE